MDRMRELDHLANRGYTEGFYRRHVPEAYQNYDQGTSANSQQQFVGEISEVDTAHGWATVEVKNRFAAGDRVELITPAGNVAFTLERIENLRGEALDAAPGSGHRVRIPLAAELSAGDAEFALLMCHR